MRLSTAYKYLNRRIQTSPKCVLLSRAGGRNRACGKAAPQGKEAPAAVPSCLIAGPFSALPAPEVLRPSRRQGGRRALSTHLGSGERRRHERCWRASRSRPSPTGTPAGHAAGAGCPARGGGPTLPTAALGAAAPGQAARPQLREGGWKPGPAAPEKRRHGLSKRATCGFTPPRLAHVPARVLSTQA